MADLSAEFTLSFTVDDESEFIASRTTIDDFEALGDDAEAAAENLDDAADLLNDLMDGYDYVEDFTATLQLAIGDLRGANNRIMDMLTRQPFEPMDLDDDLFEALNDVFDELDYVLDGGTYDLGADDVLFVLLVKTDEEASDPYGIGSGDSYVPLVLINADFDELADLIRDLDAGDAITETITALFDGSSDFMDTYLDPNAVDFEPGQSPLDVIEMLQNANPTFMQLTADGKEQMRDAGDKIRDELGRYVADIHDLRNFIDRASTLDAELDLDAEALRKGPPGPTPWCSASTPTSSTRRRPFASTARR